MALSIYQSGLTCPGLKSKSGDGQAVSQVGGRMGLCMGRARGLAGCFGLLAGHKSRCSSSAGHNMLRHSAAAAAAAGSWAEIEVDTRPGISSATRPRRPQQRTQLLLSHLSSFRDMGTAAVECVSGCTCQPSRLDGTTPSRVSIFKTHSVEVRRGGWAGWVGGWVGARVVLYCLAPAALLVTSWRLLAWDGFP